jgi:serine/threonine protein kinase
LFMSNTGRTFADRYLLDVQISSPVGTTVWRALDKVLNRWVTVYLLPTTDPRGRIVTEACLSVAANGDRDAVAILDVIESGPLKEASGQTVTQLLGIITEWAEGEGLDERLLSAQEPLDSATALAITRRIAGAIARAHERNIAHGRLRPHNIVVSNADEVRIAGFGIDRSFLGQDDSNALRADISGVGNLLFVMVTGMWPHGATDGLPSAPSHGPQVLPSTLRPGISASIDSLYQRTQAGDFSSMNEVIAAFSVGAAEESTHTPSPLSRLASHPVQWHGRPETHSHRIRATAIALVCVMGMGWIGWQLLTRNFNKSDVPVAILASPLPSMTSTPNPSVSSQPEAAEVVAISDYDPFGDQTENPDQASLAIDSDVATSWNTVNYLHQDMAGKPGVGLLLDLGAPRPVSSVNLSFLEAGVSAEIYVSDSAEPDITTAEKLGDVQDAETSAIIKAPRAISGRYVLVWLTQVPQSSDGTYKGGITEIEVGL